VDHAPYVPTLKENNVRKGFFEPPDFTSFRDNLPAYLREFAAFAYKTGWRRGEICGLEWKQVDLDRGTVRLNPGETKNNSERIAYLDSELVNMLSCKFTERKRLGALQPPNQRPIRLDSNQKEKRHWRNKPM